MLLAKRCTQWHHYDSRCAGFLSLGRKGQAQTRRGTAVSGLTSTKLLEARLRSHKVLICLLRGIQGQVGWMLPAA